MPNFDLILFDLDGTLLNTMKLITTSYQKTIKHFTGQTVDEAEIQKLVGTSIHHILSHFGIQPTEETIGFYKKTSLLFHDSMVGVYPHVKETLSLLHRQNVKLGLVTSKLKDLAARGLDLFGLSPLFTVIICMEDTIKHKPEPDPVMEACRKGNVQDMTRVLMVGDSPFDILCAQKAGAQTAVVTWSDFPLTELTAEKPDYIIEDIRDLWHIIGISAPGSV